MWFCILCIFWFMKIIMKYKNYIYLIWYVIVTSNQISNKEIDGFENYILRRNIIFWSLGCQKIWRIFTQILRTSQLSLHQDFKVVL